MLVCWVHAYSRAPHIPVRGMCAGPQLQRHIIYLPHIRPPATIEGASRCERWPQRMLSSCLPCVWGPTLASGLACLQR